MHGTSSRTIVGLVGIFALYITSFFLPAAFFRTVVRNAAGVESPAGHREKHGTQMAFASIFGPLVLNFAGLANPLFIAGCVLLLTGKSKPAVWVLALALLFTLQTFQMLKYPFYEDEARVMVSYLVRPLVGWYCWTGSIALALALALGKSLRP